MRIRADEHVAPAIVDAVRDLALSDGWELSSVHSAGHRGRDDVHWITAFSEEGGDAILTADTDFLKLEPQVSAVFNTGLKVIHLPRRWSSARGTLQAAHLLMWWPRIEDTLRTMSGRECFSPDWNLKEPKDNLRKVKIDFETARKKKKKSSRPGREARSS
ncbi:DUF5615 family PIN-like protein [Roseivivax sediminis]|uniref:DUF5615 family PIN-like protein n=1 Tax=Roseivivax sediminis TaxID=936889 RepID=UPI00122C5AC4|nr:DUF5615 family PIN-like protein [Roseivivax sediminis]